jgi:hypothetical protein
VAWSPATRLAELGGLGVLDLNTLGYALRMRWEWLARVDPSRAWTALPVKPERVIQAMFEASTSMLLGNGRHTFFWHEKWLDGSSIMQSPPDLYVAVNRRAAKSRLVCDGLVGDCWIRDI